MIYLVFVQLASLSITHLKQHMFNQLKDKLVTQHALKLGMCNYCEFPIKNYRKSGKEQMYRSQTLQASVTYTIHPYVLEISQLTVTFFQHLR